MCLSNNTFALGDKKKAVWPKEERISFHFLAIWRDSREEDKAEFHVEVEVRRGKEKEI